MAYPLRELPRARAAQPRARAARALRDGASSPMPARPRCRAASASAWRWRARSRARPDVLLLDEPLSALDARTRGRRARELAAVLREVRGAGPAGHPRLRRGRPARRPRRGDRRRPGGPGGHPERARGLAALGVRGRLHRRGGPDRDAERRARRAHAGGARRRRRGGQHRPARRARWRSASTRGRSRSSRPARRRHGSAQNRLEAEVVIVTHGRQPRRLGLAAPQPLAGRGRRSRPRGSLELRDRGCASRHLEGRGHRGWSAR